MANKRIPARLYQTEAGNEPVREWLKQLKPQERKVIGIDIKTVEYGWPIGMPTCRSMSKGACNLSREILVGWGARSQEPESSALLAPGS